ncbi:hypothetical protein SADUNF_Sadunf14G0032700 [Salix dunnii]|uniref:Ankyrin repeat family protein n=1 Tax=Salix dunnii TaxID=1413687 RepID=A0A835MLW6_9ROSI|nr:hypothetical protein SADUNF_Sadunf14G0032700 [Salix dunnii]
MDSRLFDAILSGDITAFRSLLAEDPLILARISLNSTENPLHLSSLAGQLEITREVASQKPAYIRELNQDGFSPIHIAASDGHAELVRELLRVGYEELVRACPQSVKEVATCGETVLHVAVKSNQVEIVKTIGLLIGQEAIAYGVEVNFINASRFTAKDALDFILQSGDEYNGFSILEMFQQAGAMKAMDITTNRSCFELPS